jgi:hypothetical protein
MQCTNRQQCLNRFGDRPDAKRHALLLRLVAGSATVGAAMGLLVYEREGRLIVVDAHDDTLYPRLAAILFAVPRTLNHTYNQRTRDECNRTTVGGLSRPRSAIVVHRSDSHHIASRVSSSKHAEGLGDYAIMRPLCASCASPSPYCAFRCLTARFGTDCCWEAVWRFLCRSPRAHCAVPCRRVCRCCRRPPACHGAMRARGARARLRACE